MNGWAEVKPGEGVGGGQRSESPPHGLVPRLLVPFTVGVDGSPAAIGVITGVAAPMRTVTKLCEGLLPALAIHTSPEPSTAMASGTNIAPPV